WQPLIDTYAQLQEIRTYYKFRDVDVDRYQLGDSYQQVMLSARELEPALLPPNAQTWVNLHLLFTHGNGVVMSPVTRKSGEGLPILYLQDIPPVASGGPAISQPRLYFGQGDETYVIAKTGTKEFDYPKGSDNVYSTYDGADGVAIGGIANKTLFAWYFSDPNILLSRYITAESRILFRRNVQERVGTIAPFLLLDRDPYMVISEGRLFWMQDAYTTSAWFPYAAPYAAPLPHGDLDYIRNSVKIAIDAYNGTVTFYLTDPADPVAATYQRIFPELFKPFAAIPPDLRRHVRYPEDLFLVQADMYRAYHMDAPEVFYNREDLWQFPREPTSLDGSTRGESVRMAPVLHHDAAARRGARRVLPHAADGAEPAREHDRVAGGPLRCARLWQADRLRVPQGQAGLRTVPDRRAHPPEHRDLATDLALEPDGLAGDPRQSARGADRELNPVRLAALSARGSRPITRTQAGDRGVWRSRGHGRNARPSPCRAFQGDRADLAAGQAGRNLGRRAGRGPGPRGARPLR